MDNHSDWDALANTRLAIRLLEVSISEWPPAYLIFIDSYLFFRLDTLSSWPQLHYVPHMYILVVHLSKEISLFQGNHDPMMV